MVVVALAAVLQLIMPCCFVAVQILVCSLLSYPFISSSSQQLDLHGNSGYCLSSLLYPYPMRRPQRVSLSVYVLCPKIVLQKCG